MSQRAEWKSESWAFNAPCEICGISRHDHDPKTIRHTYVTPALPASEISLDIGWGFVKDTTGGTVQRALTRQYEGQAKYMAPLPSPKERKRIREAARLTQQDLADELVDQLGDRANIHRTLISRWEKPAGYFNGRLNGREPSGRMREEDSKLLRTLIDR